MTTNQVVKVPRMSTKTMIKKYEAKGYTMADLQGNWKEHERYGVSYPEWLNMMKTAVEHIPVKDW